MSTKNKYDFFRGLYEEEERTALELEGRAKVYLSVITAFLVALVLKPDETKNVVEVLRLPGYLVLFETLLLGSSLLCVVFALQIRTYEAVANAESIVEEWKGRVPPDEEFFIDRIVDYAVATTINRRRNNQTAIKLAWAGNIWPLPCWCCSS